MPNHNSGFNGTENMVKVNGRYASKALIKADSSLIEKVEVIWGSKALAISRR